MPDRPAVPPSVEPVNALPAIDEIVVVRTRHHSGELARVVRAERSTRGDRRWWFWLGSVDGSLYGAEGWYSQHEFERARQ